MPEKHRIDLDEQAVENAHGLDPNVITAPIVNQHSYQSSDLSECLQSLRLGDDLEDYLPADAIEDMNQTTGSFPVVDLSSAEDMAETRVIRVGTSEEGEVFSDTEVRQAIAAEQREALDLLIAEGKAVFPIEGIDEDEDPLFV